MYRKILKLLILITVAIIAQTSCASVKSEPVKYEPISGEEFLLDTICSISIYEIKDSDGKTAAADKNKDDAERIMEEAFDLCRRLDDMLSRTKADSDVGRINSSKGEWVDVDPMTADIIQKGLDYSRLSEGSYDITVGSVTELWDFHAAEGEAKLPDDGALKEATKHVDYRNVELDGNKVRLKDPDIKIDLGGIAKGYIGDRMSGTLNETGVTSAIINLGGNVICIGSKPGGEDFVIGIETPYSDHSEISGKVDVSNKTLVTSGVYERRIEVDGKTYHHILNPETGYPVDSDVDGVTLITDTGRSADIDALSTICLIKGYEKGAELIDGMDGIEAVFILKNGEIIKTDGANFTND